MKLCVFSMNLENGRLLFVFIIFRLFNTFVLSEEFCYLDSKCESSPKQRFLLYDVNPPEGFNLRRDVYMRFAILAHKLKKSKNEKLENFNLVLPPWSRLYHWRYSETPEQIPWSLYFDINSLKSFAPVMEMYEFFEAINQTPKVVIDDVYILQHFEDMFETGNFKDRMKIDKCSRTPEVNYFFYKNITSYNIKCVSYHGPATKLSKLLLSTSAKTILLHHAEVALYEAYGNKLYWQCRRSMRFNKELQEIAAQFRKNFLNSTNELDKTILPENWKDEKPGRSAIGGPYLSVHLRRRDFLRSRANQIPSIDNVAKQIKEFLEKLNLTSVFIATDATDEEYKELLKKIPSQFNVFKYVPSSDITRKYKDGGVAIIDQIICSYARHFVGTFESTFSFRIQEEREILGFSVESTFNSLCKTSDDCLQPTVWKIVY